MTNRRANNGREQGAVRKRQRREEGHPLFWLLLGFLCGVMATLGVLLIWVGGAVGERQTIRTPLAAITAAPRAPAPPSAPPAARVDTPPPSARPLSPQPPEAAPNARAAAPRAEADQIAEDAAASGLTARTR